MNTARLNQGTPLLLNGVTKRYGDNSILNGLDLHIPAGMKPARRWPPLGWKIAPMNGLPHSRVDRSSALRWRGR